MALAHDSKGPYSPPSAVIEVIVGFRDRGLRTPFTTDVLIAAGVTESLAPRTLQALRVLDLVDSDGAPTETLLDLRKAPTEDDFKQRFEQWLRAAYAEVFQFTDPATDSPDRVRGAFRSYVPHGQQERMVTLFIGLCDFAGLIPPDAPSRTALGRAATTKGATPRAKRVATTAKPKVPREPTTGTTPPASPSQNPPARSTGMHPFVAGLLDTLPPTGAEWPAADREKWTDAALAVFNLIYALPASSAEGGDDR